MKKRLLSGLLAAAMLLALAPAALAASVPAQDEVAQVLAALDIMVGDENGNLNLGSTVTRAEFAKLSVAATPAGDAVGDTVSISPYPDVPKTNWAAPWIKAAVDQGLVKGNLHGYFEPNRTITLAEGVTIALRLLGYQDNDFTGVWPAGQMAQYRALKLDVGVTCGTNDAMSRKDAMYLFYNLMTAASKTTGTYYINTLEPGMVNAAGEIDRVALINSAMEGPVVAEGNWQSQIPFNVNTAKVYRGGASSTLSAVQNLDVVYWSESMRTIWAYNNKATGTYEKASPSASAPTSVTVAGKTYAIENTAAAFDLSDLGAYQVGDNVTVLLGRDGGVAAVRSAVQSSSVVYGMVIAANTNTYEDSKGNAYTANAITVRATDGNEYTYQVSEKSLKAGALVRVSSGENGVTAKRLTTTSLSGKVNAAGTKIGSYALADDVEILDVYKETGAVKVYPSRIAGVNLTEKMVKFYATNAQGEISHLILDDVTGDCHAYGILTEVSEVNGTSMSSMTVMGTYTFDIGGTEMTWVNQNSVYGVGLGPCQIKGLSTGTMGVGGVERIFNLDGVRLESVEGKQGFTSGNKTYTISDSVAVYEVRNGNYYYTSLERVTGGDYTLTGYYDKAESEGGRIRVILAQ